MKTKDIITILIAVAILGISGYFLYKMLAPTPVKTTVDTQNTTETKQLTDEEYEATLKEIAAKKDYGEATLDNIGRTNPFSPPN